MSQLCWEAGKKKARLTQMEGWSWAEGVEPAVSMGWMHGERMRARAV